MEADRRHLREETRGRKLEGGNWMEGRMDGGENGRGDQRPAPQAQIIIINPEMVIVCGITNKLRCGYTQIDDDRSCCIIHFVHVPLLKSFLMFRLSHDPYFFDVDVFVKLFNLFYE